MRNIFSIVAITLFVSISSQAAQVYKCQDGTRSFVINRTSKGYTGLFQDFNGKPQKFACENRGGRPYFKCYKNDYIVTVVRSATGGMMVDFELEGDFFPDSGYLFSLYCK